MPETEKPKDMKTPAWNKDSEVDRCHTMGPSATPSLATGGAETPKCICESGYYAPGVKPHAIDCPANPLQIQLAALHQRHGGLVALIQATLPPMGEGMTPDGKIRHVAQQLATLTASLESVKREKEEANKLRHSLFCQRELQAQELEALTRERDDLRRQVEELRESCAYEKMCVNECNRETEEAIIDRDRLRALCDDMAGVLQQFVDDGHIVGPLKVLERHAALPQTGGKE